MENKKILLVEDDQFTRELYEEVLKDAGFAVDTAVDGVDGLSKMTVGGYNLILLDVMMPKMNGLEVLKSLKASEATKKIPVVMLTNLAGQEDAETALKLGAVRYIVKSEHEPEEVTKIVKGILKGYTREEVPTG